MAIERRGEVLQSIANSLNQHSLHSE